MTDELLDLDRRVGNRRGFGLQRGLHDLGIAEVGHDEDALVVGGPFVGHDVGVRVDDLQGAAAQRRARLPEREQSAVPVQERGGVGVLGLDVDVAVVVVERQPRGDARRGEPGARFAAPLHGNPNLVAVDAFGQAPVDPFGQQPGDHAGHGVVGLAQRDVAVRHPDLLALVEHAGASERAQQGRHHPGLAQVAAEAGQRALPVVVLDDVASARAAPGTRARSARSATAACGPGRARRGSRTGTPGSARVARRHPRSAAARPARRTPRRAGRGRRRTRRTRLAGAGRGRSSRRCSACGSARRCGADLTGTAGGSGSTAAPGRA